MCIRKLHTSSFPRRRESSGIEPKAFLDSWIPACAGMTNTFRQHGATLIELVMFIVIISTAVVGILQVMNLVTSHSADPLVRKQALAIAESLLEEIELQDFSNPSGGFPGPYIPANRASFDDIFDYSGFATTGIYAVDGVTTIPNLGNYNVSATVNATTVATALSGIPPASAAIITVTVTDPTGQQTVATGYRTNY